MACFLTRAPAPLFDQGRKDRSPVPTKLASAAARRAGQGRPQGRRGRALSLTGASPVARWLFVGAASLLSALVAPGGQALAQQPAGVSLADLIAEASARFGVPAPWITAVMRQESAFRTQAVSHAGAMGLMQVMPKTYAELRARYGLGPDPFEPRDNILAGAAYIREMYDQFGAPGFLAAYNAGPARYQQHLATGRALPLETRIYVARIAPALSMDAAPAAVPVHLESRPPTLFVRVGGAPDDVPPPSAQVGGDAPDPASSPLFVVLSPSAVSQ